MGGVAQEINNLLQPATPTFSRTCYPGELRSSSAWTQLPNAAHASGDQGVVRVELGHTRLAAEEARGLELDPGADDAKIRVDEQGTGIDAAAMANIFEPFFPIKPGGVGIRGGLSVVRSILRSGKTRSLSRGDSAPPTPTPSKFRSRRRPRRPVPTDPVRQRIDRKPRPGMP